MTQPDPLVLEFTRLQRTLFARALRITKHEADAEDVVQAAFLRACEQRERQTVPGHWPSWLSTVAQRLAIDVARSRSRIPPSIDPDEVEHAPPEPEAAWESLSNEHVQSAAQAACRPGSFRIYDLYYNQRLSQREIAEQLHLAPSSVAARIHRARLSIRARLEAALQIAAGAEP